MKISILGAGAMGMLFGGYLSEHNDVWLIDIDQNRIDYINANGVAVRESTGEDKFFRPVGMTNAANLGKWTWSLFL